MTGNRNTLLQRLQAALAEAPANIAVSPSAPAAAIDDDEDDVVLASSPSCGDIAGKRAAADDCADSDERVTKKLAATTDAPTANVEAGAAATSPSTAHGVKREDEQPPTGAEPPVSKKVAAVDASSAPAATPAQLDTAALREMSLEGLLEKTSKELSAYCVALGLAKSGTKLKCATRIRQHFEQEVLPPVSDILSGTQSGKKRERPKKERVHRSRTANKVMFKRTKKGGSKPGKDGSKPLERTALLGTMHLLLPSSPLRELLELSSQNLSRARGLVYKLSAVLVATFPTLPFMHPAFYGALVRSCLGHKDAFKDVNGGVVCASSRAEFGSAFAPTTTAKEISKVIDSVLTVMPKDERISVFSQLKGNTLKDFVNTFARQPFVFLRRALVDMVVLRASLGRQAYVRPRAAQSRWPQ